jgi:hypothetical protein
LDFFFSSYNSHSQKHIPAFHGFIVGGARFQPPNPAVVEKLHKQASTRRVPSYQSGEVSAPKKNITILADVQGCTEVVGHCEPSFHSLG